VPTLRLQDSLSERFLTSRHHPAMIRRVLAMEDEVHRKSISFDEQSLQQLSVRSRTNSSRCRHLLCLVCRFAQFSRGKNQKEVSPLSRPAMLSMGLTQPVSVPLQSGIRFLLPLMSAPPSAHLAMCFPLWGAIRIYPVPLE
jgi:hypothetical protein